ncbi:35675_t:CDS:2, partial [Gigaspora margarita]
AKINEIINSTIPENTQKATAKWVKILENWRHDVGYNYRIETVTDKDQLEREMTEKEFPHLWEALNGKMKKLKKEGLVLRHHDHLADTELQTIFQHYTVANNTPQGLQYRVFMWCCLLFQPRGGEHYNMLTEQFEFTSNGGIHFKKYSQKNDQGGMDGNSDALIVPVPPDPKGSQGPVYDIKLYFSKRPLNSKCPFLHLKINKKINNYSKDPWYLNTRLGAKSCGSFMKDICTTKGVAMGTTMSITGHKSESSYRIYARPSNKQKEDALSLLIDSVGTLPSNSQESEALTKDDKEIIMNLKQPKISSFRSASELNPNLTKPFRQPLRKTTKTNLTLHINAIEQNPTIGGRQNIYKTSYEDEEDNFFENSS